MKTQEQDPVNVLAVAPYEMMAAALSRCAEDYPGVRLDTFTGDLEEGLEILRTVDLSRYDAIISRGGTADMIQQLAEIPVIEVPVRVYDILRTINLARNYTDKLAIVGFPGVTGNAHTLCNLLGLDFIIETVHSQEEVHDVLKRLRARQINTVVCDVVSHRIARASGFQALLITSGESSLQMAIESAERQGRIFSTIQNEIRLLKAMLRQDLQQCVVLNSNRDVVYSFSRNLSDETLAAMRRKISAIPENRDFLFYHQEGSVLHAVTASRLDVRGQKLYLFRDQPAQIPLRSGQSGIRIYDAAECEQIFSGSFFTLSGSIGGELEHRISTLASVDHPVMILGEEGTGREQIARALYLQSEKRNHPFVIVDGESINDRSWNYLTGHHTSPLSTVHTTMFFCHLEKLSSQRQQTLLSLIDETGMARRLWLIFACEAVDGRPLHAVTREIMSRLSPLALELPTLRSRRDEIPALANLYLSNLNVELGRQLFGFEPSAIEMLTRYDWPENYTQFKHVLHEAAVRTEGTYISGAVMAELLARVRKFHHTQTDGIGGFSPGNMTLDEITRKIIEQTLADNQGNQSLTARQLGISRSTLWRILSAQPGKK
jgi:transcriptional regulator with PAS, ATPase and Fis domain